MNEDLMRSRFDSQTTHTDPHSPYYDGPLVGEDICEHGFDLDEECEECRPMCACCEDKRVSKVGEFCLYCAYKAMTGNDNWLDTADGKAYLVEHRREWRAA